MKYMLLSITLLILAACDDAPHQQVEPPPKPKPVIKVIAAKISNVETSTDINWLSTMTRKGIHTKQNTETVYYVIFTDGSKARVPMEEWAVVNVGDKKEVLP